MKLDGAKRLMGSREGRFDGHAHVFHAGLPMAAQRRYTPTYDAGLEDYIALLTKHGLDGALLVQPSFLGIDNSFLVNSLRTARRHGALTFRGVVMLDPAMSHDQIARLSAEGIVGMRLNLVGGAARGFDIDPWDGLLRRIDAAGWHIEIHCEGPFLPPLLKELLARCETVVVDHFGLPDQTAPLRCPGHRALFEAPPGRVVVKASAPYRVFPHVPTARAIERCSSILASFSNHFDPGQLAWGSDWPWTRFEARHTYEELIRWYSQ